MRSIFTLCGAAGCGRIATSRRACTGSCVGRAGLNGAIVAPGSQKRLQQPTTGAITEVFPARCAEEWALVLPSALDAIFRSIHVSAVNTEPFPGWLSAAQDSTQVVVLAENPGAG
mmetsp:Transcript_2738/g.6384  ORF Transcript_2738/g.6384 Transcript_2738/m.6384 type:complete len:115 (-) Transcript_2738:645-989(-)